MVDEYFRWTGQRKRIALVTATNDEADAVNHAIQQRRIEHGQLDPTQVALGIDDQHLLRGDLVQTRRNDHRTGVENRALWVVGRIGSSHMELVSVNDSADIRVIDADYAAEHVHLAYASTVHGIQGETTDASIVGPGVDAAGLYVGMTRGRLRNEAITVASTPRAAREKVAASMMRACPRSASRMPSMRLVRNLHAPHDRRRRSRRRAVGLGLPRMQAHLGRRTARGQRGGPCPGDARRCR